MIDEKFSFQNLAYLSVLFVKHSDVKLKLTLLLEILHPLYLE